MPGIMSSNTPRGICLVKSTVKKATIVKTPVTQYSTPATIR